MAQPSIISFVLRSKNRFEVLKFLADGQKFSAQVEKHTGMYKTHVSRALKELQDKKLITCINQEDRSYKFYKLTALGKRTLDEIKDILQTID